MSDYAQVLRSNPVYEACVAELDKFGLSHTIEKGGKHFKIVFMCRGVEMKKPIAGTPGDRIRGPDKARADIRRLIHLAEKRSPGQVVVSKPSPAPAVKDQQRTETMQATTATKGDPIVIVNKGRVITDSRNVANYFEKRHADVLRAIRGVQCSDAFRESNFALREENQPHNTGASKSTYVLMTKDGFSFLVLGFTGRAAGAFREAYIAKFNAMEAELYRRPAIGEDAMGGIVKAVVRKALTDELRDIRAGQELSNEALGNLTKRLDGMTNTGGVVSVEFGGGMITAYQVVEMAEVPREKRFSRLTEWVQHQLRAHCGRHGHAPRLVPVYPGERWCFDRAVVQKWLEEGGKVEILRQIEVYWRKRANKKVIPLREDQGSA